MNYKILSYTFIIAFLATILFGCSGQNNNVGFSNQNQTSGKMFFYYLTDANETISDTSGMHDLGGSLEFSIDNIQIKNLDSDKFLVDFNLVIPEAKISLQRKSVLLTHDPDKGYLKIDLKINDKTKPFKFVIKQSDINQMNNDLFEKLQTAKLSPATASKLVLSDISN